MNAASRTPSHLPPDVAIADTDELRDEIYRFRYEISLEERGRSAPGVDHEARMIPDEAGESTLLLYACNDGRVVGTARLDFSGSGPIPDRVREWFGTDQFADYPNEELAFFHQIMVASAWRKSHIKGRLIEACYQIAREHGVKFAFCSASPHLVRMYEARGFRRYKEDIPVEGCGHLVPLVCVVEDVAHLAAMRSPFLEIARRFDNSPETRKWFRANFPKASVHACRQVPGPEELWKHLSSKLPMMSPLLRGLSTNDIKRILCAGTILHCKAGDVIINQGELASDLSLVLSGLVEVRRHFDHGEYRVHCLSSGGVMGAESFDNDLPRSADFVALTDLEIVVLTPSGIERALRGKDEAKRTLTANVHRMAQEHLVAWADALLKIQQAA